MTLTFVLDIITPGNVTILTTRDDDASTGFSLLYFNGKLELVFATETETITMLYNMYPGIVHFLITFDNAKYKKYQGKETGSVEFASVFMNYNIIKPQSVEIIKAKHKSEQSKFIIIGGPGRMRKNGKNEKDSMADTGEFTIEHILLWEHVLDHTHIVSFFDNLNSV